jgi:hypothetical protein
VSFFHNASSPEVSGSWRMDSFRRFGWWVAIVAVLVCAQEMQPLRAGECHFIWLPVDQGGGSKPPYLFSPAFAYDSFRNVAVLVGGQERAGTDFVYREDTWEWNGTSWTRRNPSIKPPNRRDAAMAFDSDRKVCVLFGGGTNIFSDQIPFNDTWEWDGNIWTVRSTHNPGATDQPPPIDYPIMCYDAARKKVVLWGAYERVGGSIKDLTNTWTWDGTTWERIASAPTHRSDSAMVYDPVRREVLLFGGSIPLEGGGQNDTWVWNGTNWAKKVVSGPPARHEHAMAFDSRRGVVVMVGGNGRGETDSLSDTWEWNGETWTFQPNADASLTARQRHLMWYESTSQRLVLYSGRQIHTGTEPPVPPDLFTDMFEGRPPGLWIDFNYSGQPSLPEDGRFLTPYNTLLEGVAIADPGCTLRLKSGVSAETITIIKAMRLEAEYGPVTIGNNVGSP